MHPAVPRARTRWLLAAALLAGLAQCAAPGVSRPAATGAGTPSALPHLRPDARLQQLIDPRPAPGAHAWLGGDAASSTAVGDGRWVWIFGDTLLGTVRDRCPDGRFYCNREVDNAAAGMIPNSVGVMTRREDGSLSPIVKYWGTRDGEPGPIFTAERPGEFLWPLALAYARGALLIAASRHTRARGLHSLGNVILRIANPAMPPPDWRITRHPLPHVVLGSGTRRALTWSTALVPAGEFLYIFGKHGTGVAATSVLARVPLARTHDPAWRPAPEYWLGPDVTWGSFDLTRLHALDGLPGTSEATIAGDDARGWYTFQIPWPAFEIHLYTASELAGPWHDRGVVYRVPAPWSTTVADCTGAIGTCPQRYLAYAVKSHPELAPPGGHALSFNVNLLAGTRRTAELAAEAVDGFYVPRMIATPPGR